MTLLSIAAVMKTLQIMRLNLGAPADWFLSPLPPPPPTVDALWSKFSVVDWISICQSQPMSKDRLWLTVGLRIYSLTDGWLLSGVLARRWGKQTAFGLSYASRNLHPWLVEIEVFIKDRRKNAEESWFTRDPWSPSVPGSLRKRMRIENVEKVSLSNSRWYFTVFLFKYCSH